MRKDVLVLLCISALLFFLEDVPLKAENSWSSWRPTYIQTVDVSSENHSLYNNIAAITKDKRGLIWIATKGSGLVRYDGQHADVFRYSPTEKFSLPDNVIHTLAPTYDGGLLLGTDVAGVIRFDPKDNKFYSYPTDGYHNLGNRIYRIIADKNGGYWVGSDIGLSHIDSDLKSTHQIFVFCQAHGTCTSQTKSIWQDDDGTVFIATNTAILRRLASEQQFHPVHFSNISSRKIAKLGISALYRDHRGRLWIGTETQGVFYQAANGTLQQRPELSADSSFIRYHSIRDFIETNKNELWIGTEGSGIVAFNEATEKVRSIHRDTENPEIANSDSICSFYREKSGNIWIATDGNVAFYNAAEDHVFNFDDRNNDNLKALASRNVYSILVTKKGQIWLGLSNGQIDWLDKKHDLVRHLKLKGPPSGESIHSLIEMNDGSILVGSKGLNVIDPDKLNITPYFIEDLPKNLVINILIQKNDEIYIGTSEGLFVYNVISKELNHFTHDNDNKDSLSNNRILDLAFNNKGVLAIATAKGFSFYYPDSHHFDNIFHDERNENTLPNDYIASLAIDHKIIWAGIRGGLIYNSEERIKAFLPFLAISLDKSSLIYETIQSLENDTRNRLWMAGNEKIAVFDKSSKKIHLLSQRDNSEKVTYYPHSIAVGPEGEMLFGGSNGLTVIDKTFNPDDIPAFPTDLALTDIEINEKKIVYGKLPESGQATYLPSHIRSLRLRFALLDYASSHQIHYSYRLVGQDTQWLDLPPDTPPFVIYSHLPGGNFVFEIKAVVPGLNKPVFEAKYPFIVAHSWYELWPIRIIFVILSICGIYFIITSQTKTLRKIIEKRTFELQITNKRLKALANTDELTGLLNRRAFTSIFNEFCANFAQDHKKFSVFILDIDHFKVINDRDGHLAGDIVIQYIASKISDNIRDRDVAARYGGEEFVVILPNTEIKTAEVVATRIGKIISDKPVIYQDKKIPVTVSIGLAMIKVDDTPDSLLERADKRLYSAKEQGRNRVSS
ncbi:diguanylate cyclase with beta propeller sensor [Zymomonas mobilis subsp. pomaceae ATCC 29192]|uniref:diguanylate cyclase n=2 Tax=Zymomonas mobilis TaxID=542 RepID=F8EUW5_ZYMMT|nr:diguanylate cyclase with beta propeller sensor [Zymomonas mobilis subsp. pomaceae ATCC 29192]